MIMSIKICPLPYNHKKSICHIINKMVYFINANTYTDELVSIYLL